jgi:hypothetical protein
MPVRYLALFWWIGSKYVTHALAFMLLSFIAAVSEIFSKFTSHLLRFRRILSAVVSKYFLALFEPNYFSRAAACHVAVDLAFRPTIVDQHLMWVWRSDRLFKVRCASCDAFIPVDDGSTALPRDELARFSYCACWNIVSNIPQNILFTRVDALWHVCLRDNHQTAQRLAWSSLRIFHCLTKQVSFIPTFTKSDWFT